MDVTTVALAVDSSQVNSAAAALEKMSAAGKVAESSTAKVTQAAIEQNKALLGTVTTAGKAATAMKGLAEGTAATGKAAQPLSDAGAALDKATTKANGTKAALQDLAKAAEQAGARVEDALSKASQGPVVAPVSAAPVRPGAAPARVPGVAPATVPAAAPATAQVNAFTAAATQASASAKRLQESEQALALASAKAEAAQASLTAATARNAAAQQELATATASGLASQGQIAQAQQRAAAAQAAMLGAQARVTTTTQAAAKAAEAHRAALGSMGKQSALTANQLQQVGFQLNDFFVQVSSGGSPLTALIQQGSQLSGTFGGVGNASKALLSLITPLRAGLIGIGAGVGVFALAAKGAEDFARSLGDVQAALAGTGRGGSFSDSQIADLIEQLSKLPGVSRDAATQTITEFARIREIGGEFFAGLGSLAADYARVTGKEVPAAAKELGKAFADPEKGAKALDDALGTLSSSTLLTVQRLSEQGDVLGAQRVLYDELTRKIGGLASEGTTPLQKSVNDLGNAWNSLMGSFRRSEGLERANENIGKFLGLIQSAVEALPKLEQASTNAFRGSAFGRLIGIKDTPAPSAASGLADARGGATGGFDAPGGASASFAAAAPDADTAIKKAIELGKAYEGTRGQVERLTATLKTLQQARDQAEKFSEGGKNSPQYKKLTTQIEGVNEAIASAKKKGAGPKDREPEQIRRAALEADLNAFQATLQQERDALSFHNQFVRGEYQAGNLSLRQFYEDRRQSIADGVAAEIKELQAEKDRLAKDLTVTKDPSEREKLNGRIAEATAEQERARLRASNDVALTNQEETASFKALSDQVANYRANLAQLQGDEVGAARIRAQQAIEQASVLSRQTAERGTGAFSREDRGQQGGVDVADLQRTLQGNITLQKARQESNRLTGTLQIEEERIALQQQRGSITEYDALQRVGVARRAAIAELEKQVAAQEEVAKTRPQDYELQISTQRARLELDKLKDSLDPLAEKFSTLFRDSGASAIEDILNGAKSLKGAVLGFGESIVKRINADTARAASDAIFGKGGVLGGAGGVFAKVFGPKQGEAQKQGSVEVGPLQTSAVTQSLTSLQTVGIDPTTSALGRLQVAADAAAASVGRPVAPGVSGVTPAVLPVPQALPTTGDLARADRVAEAGTADAAESAQALSSSLVDTRTNAQRFSEVMGPAVGILASLGGAGSSAAQALALLPAIIAAASASSAASGASSGGGIFSSIGSLFSSGSKPTTGDFARMDRAGASDGGGFFASVGDFFASFFHSGGVVGQKRDMRAVNPGVFAGASKYHAGGIVGGEALASLKANEVPAILLGGPKGVREEVLKASDPRHKDNLSPILLKTIQDAQGNPASVLSVIASGGKGGDGGEGGSAVSTLIHREQKTRELSPLTQFLIGSPATVRGLIGELSQEGDFESADALRSLKPRGARELGGPVSPNSLYRVNERGPEVLKVAGKSYLMTGNERGTVEPQAQKEGRPVNVTINNQFAPGTNHQTIGQGAVKMGAVVRRELARGTA